MTTIQLHFTLCTPTVYRGGGYYYRSSGGYRGGGGKRGRGGSERGGGGRESVDQPARPAATTAAAEGQ